jgi:hypothetical protein
MNLTPINGPRIAPTLGAKTVSSDAARTAAMAKFNEGLTAAASPSQEGAVLDPASKVAEVPAPEVTQGLNNEASSAGDTAPSDLEAKRIASHYANLARKEKMLRIREAQFRQRIASASNPTPPSQTQPAFDASKYVAIDDLRKNTFGVLNNIGMTYEELTQKALDAPSAEDLQQRRQIEALTAKIELLEKGQDQVKKTFDENQSLARQQAEMQIHQDVKRLVAQDPQFEVINAQRASSEVVRLITSVYDKGMGPEYPRGTILDISDAAMMVEQELTLRALRVAKLQKIQSQLNSNNVAKKPIENNQQQAQPNSLRTLTNSVGTSTRKLSARERALLAFRGEVA